MAQPSTPAAQSDSTLAQPLANPDIEATAGETAKATGMSTDSPRPIGGWRWGLAGP